MSRIGKKPVPIPSGVTVSVDKSKVTVKGPKGSLSLDVPAVCAVAQEGNEVIVTRANDEKFVRALICAGSAFAESASATSP